MDVDTNKRNRTERSENQVAIQDWKRLALKANHLIHTTVAIQVVKTMEAPGPTHLAVRNAKNLLTNYSVEALEEVQLEIGKQILFKNLTACAEDSMSFETASAATSNHTRETFGSWKLPSESRTQGSTDWQHVFKEAAQSSGQGHFFGEEPPQCLCRMPCKININSWAGKDKDRVFWNCQKKPREACDFFSWTKEQPFWKGVQGEEFLGKKDEEPSGNARTRI